jgi:hypothetical protein
LNRREKIVAIINDDTISRQRQVEYEVLWKNGERSWEPIDHLEGCLALLYEYLQKNEPIHPISKDTVDIKEFFTDLSTYKIFYIGYDNDEDVRKF